MAVAKKLCSSALASTPRALPDNGRRIVFDSFSVSQHQRNHAMYNNISHCFKRRTSMKFVSFFDDHFLRLDFIHFHLDCPTVCNPFSLIEHKSSTHFCWKHGWKYTVIGKNVQDFVLRNVVKHCSAARRLALERH